MVNTNLFLSLLLLGEGPGMRVPGQVISAQGQALSPDLSQSEREANCTSLFL